MNKPPPSGATPIDAVPTEPQAAPIIIDKNAPKCLACGRYHGSVNVELNCLRAEILRLRARFPCSKCNRVLSKHCAHCKGTGNEP